MINLHMHTKYSDGTNDVLEILSKAEFAGLKLISVTDHNTVKFYDELRGIDYKKNYSGKIISGCELAFLYNGRIKEILAYDFDIEEFKKLGFVDNIEIEQLKIKYLLNKFDLNNIKHTLFENIKMEGNAIRTMYYDIINYEENKKVLSELGIGDFNDFKFNHVYKEQSPIYLDFSKIYPNIDEVVSKCRKINCILMLAHPFKGIDKHKAYRELLEIINNKYVDGLECYNRSHTEEYIDLLINICKINNLYKSGGTDYHGKSDELPLDYYDIEYDFIDDWYKKSKN